MKKAGAKTPAIIPTNVGNTTNPKSFMGSSPQAWGTCLKRHFKYNTFWDTEVQDNLDRRMT